MDLRPPTWLLLLVSAILPAGCSVRGDVEMLESELRRQEQVQEQLSEQLKSAREELRVARSDAEGLRAQMASRGETALVAEQAEALYKVEAIRFNTLLTTGFDRDGRPGDDGISVLILPVDSQGDLVKLAGQIELELVDLSRSGDEQRLGRWQFSSDEVREHWHRGFLSAGYLFKLDWQNAPVSPELTLHARLTAPDGRAFDATTQVKVNPAGSAGAAPLARTPRGKSDSPSRASHAAYSSDDDPPPLPKRIRRPVKPQKRTASKPARQADDARVETSDKWTGETIPYLR